MSLYSDVLTVLGRAEVQNIQFRVDDGVYCGNAALLVSGALFTEVAGYVRDGRIRVQTGEVPAGLGAVYRPGEDTMRFRSDSFLGDAPTEGYVMHEAVHAWMDANARREGDPVTEECMGMIVHELYLRHMYNASMTTDDSASGDVFARTRDVVRAKNLERDRNAHVTFRDVWPLYDAIARHPSYAHLCGAPEHGQMCLDHRTRRNDGLNRPAGNERF